MGRYQNVQFNLCESQQTNQVDRTALNTPHAGLHSWILPLTSPDEYHDSFSVEQEHTSNILSKYSVQRFLDMERADMQN